MTQTLKKKAPVEKTLLVVDTRTLFASGVVSPADETVKMAVTVNDLRPKPGAGVIDSGVAIPGLNDEFSGAAPDRGAYELDGPLPHYGPQPLKK